jgi:hypothetical protein
MYFFGYVVEANNFDLLREIELASGCKAAHLISSKLWWQGTTFLQKSKGE